MMINLNNTSCEKYLQRMLKKSVFPDRILLSTGISLMIMMLWASAPALAQEAIQGEEPTPATVQEEKVPMERSFEEKPSRPGFFPSLKEKLKDADPFFRDTKVDLNLRTYYLLLSNYDASVNEALAYGGALSYKSGWLYDRFRVGDVVAVGIKATGALPAAAADMNKVIRHVFPAGEEGFDPAAAEDIPRTTKSKEQAEKNRRSCISQALAVVRSSIRTRKHPALDRDS